MEDKIIKKLVEHDDRLDRIEEKVNKIDSKLEGFDNFMAGQDKIIKILETMQQENLAGKNREDRLEEKIDDHEVRINKLEVHTQTV